MRPSALRVLLLNAFLVSFLVIIALRFTGSDQPRRPGRFLRTSLPLIAACIAANGAILYLLARRQRRLAARVISELRGGNLAARFPARDRDELGELYDHFNRMADEIERLVTRLRAAETTRTQLLRELSHDVRTPLTSVRFMVETIADRADELPPAELRETAGTVLGELHYFERLVEDLFLLAQIDEPAYRPDAADVALVPLLREECGKLGASARFPDLTFTVEGDDGAAVRGDAQLLRRLARNLVENAAAFARREVVVTVRRTKGDVELVVSDDGPGFSAEAAAAYGERRKTRLLDATSGKRVSLGLGSVIASNVARAHGGELRAANRTRPDGSPGGGQITVRFPAISELAAAS